MTSTSYSTDYSQGFGGKFGVQKDRQDKAAAGWDHIEKVEKHESQKGRYMKTVMIWYFFCAAWNAEAEACSFHNYTPHHKHQQHITTVFVVKNIMHFLKTTRQYHDNDSNISSLYMVHSTP